MRSPDSIGTVRARRLHYFWFCHHMRWSDNLLLEGDYANINWLCMQCISASAGHSIYCKSISKVATIEQYLLAVASFLAQFSGTDFGKDHPMDSHMGHTLASVLKDLKKYESVPDRCEPYDPQMHAAARLLLATQCDFTDGFKQGYCAGYRLSEWAQPARQSNPLNPQLNHLASRCCYPHSGPCRLRILTVSRHRVSGIAILDHPLLQIAKMWVIWRTQKNGQIGEEKLFARNPNQTGFCFVSSAYRALVRFQQLMILGPCLHPNATPLSVYWSTSARCVKLITADDIEHFIRRLAIAVYHLHPVKDSKDLRRWSSHSLRVGACVALHAMWFSPLDIQWILRWRSQAFMVYLRIPSLYGLPAQHGYPSLPAV
jgi:hypothetical protein